MSTRTKKHDGATIPLLGIIAALLFFNLLGYRLFATIRTGTLSGAEGTYEMLAAIVCVIIIVICVVRPAILEDNRWIGFVIFNVIATVVAISSYGMGKPELAMAIWSVSGLTIIWPIMEKLGL